MSKWFAENVGPHTNILVEDATKPMFEWEPVGIGFPNDLARRLVEFHNQTLTATPNPTKFTPEQFKELWCDIKYGNVNDVKEKWKDLIEGVKQ